MSSPSLRHAACAVLVGLGAVACSSRTTTRDAAGSPTTPSDGGRPGEGFDGSVTPPTMPGDTPPSIDEFPLFQLKANGFTFDVRLAGPEYGDLVLLLHGFPETSYEWRYQMRALVAAGYRVLAPDQRGYSPGARPAATDDYDLALLVQDALELVNAVGARRFHLVGHDWGAAVAWGLGMAYGERVITLSAFSVPHLEAFREVLADPTSCQHDASAYFDVFSQPDSEDAFLSEDAAALRATYSEFPADVSAEYLRVLGTKPALSAALNWYRANIRNRQLRERAAGRITMPTMMVWSDADPFLCRDGAELTKNYVDAPYHLEVIEGVSHWIPELAAPRVNALLLKHLAQ